MLQAIWMETLKRYIIRALNASTSCECLTGCVEKISFFYDSDKNSVDCRLIRVTFFLFVAYQPSTAHDVSFSFSYQPLRIDISLED